MTRVCFVVAAELTAHAFLRRHIRSIGRIAQVSLAANTNRKTFSVDNNLECPAISVPIEREVAVLRDLAALWALYRAFRRGSFTVVHSVTPKAGLLSMLAGYLARVPIRIHTFTGQVWATRAGFKRHALKLADKLIAGLATDVLADSHSQLEFLVEERVVAADKAQVLANGSIAGVETDRFRLDGEVRETVRRSVEFQRDDVVFLYLGRLNREKGLFDLAEAFSRLAVTEEHARLLVVGPDEAEIVAGMKLRLGAYAPRARFKGYTDAPERYIMAADVLCLPSLREGFGTVILEAAAVGVPAVGSRIYGIVDAIDDGVTGLLHDPADVAGILSAMEAMVRDGAQRLEMGAAAKQRAERLFRAEMVSNELVRFYESLLGDANRGSHRA